VQLSTLKVCLKNVKYKILVFTPQKDSKSKNSYIAKVALSQYSKQGTEA